MKDPDAIPEAEIVGLQFGLVTAEDVNNWSVCELDKTSTKKNIPVLRTVNCSSQGPTNAAALCITCGNDLEHCTGHIAKFTLYQPVSNVNFFPNLLKVFSSLCVRCGRLLLPDNHPRRIKAAKLSATLSYKQCLIDLVQLTAGYRLCWFPKDPAELAAAHKKKKKKKKPKKRKKKPKKKIGEEEEEEDEDSVDEEQEGEEEIADDLYEKPHHLSAEEAQTRGYCGARQPHMWIRDEGVLIRPTYYIAKEEEFATLPVITPLHLYNNLRFVTPEVTRLFGFNPELSPLHAMMVSSFLVPPLLIRLTRSAHGCEDDLTKTLRVIQKHNLNARKDVVPNLTLGLVRTSVNANFTATEAKKKMVRVQGPMTTKLMRKKQPIVPACLEDYFLLQRAAACLWDSKYHTNLDTEYNSRIPFCLKRRFAPSKRGNKGRVRQNMMGRRGDYTIRGVSSPNTDMDIDEIGIPIRAMMHVSIPEIVTERNFNDMLRLVLNGQHKYPGCNFVEIDGRFFLPEANFGGLKLGYTVHRHMQDGDPVIGNRQPSLWRFAIMGSRAKASLDDTMEGHLGPTTVLNEDFDGDEKNVYVPQDIMERAEVKYLMSVRQNLMKDGHLVIGFVQHSVLGAYKLTDTRRGDVRLTQEEVQQYLMIGNHVECMSHVMDRWQAFNGCKDITGREFMHLLLPTYDPAKMKKPLTKETLNRCMGETIENMTDMNHAAFRIGFLTRIFEAFCSDCGVSIHIDDVVVDVPKETIKQTDGILQDAITLSNAIANIQQQQEEDEMEEDVCKLVGKYREVMGKYVVDFFHNQTQRECGMYDIVLSRSKGTEANIIQNDVVVGQQMNEYSVRYSDTTSHYYRNVLAQYGFVQHSFLDGLTPTEFFFHLRGARVGLISTPCSTGESGYIYRKIWKSTEDERVAFDNSVENAIGQIILFAYGFDTHFLHSVNVRVVSMTIEEVVKHFATHLDVESVEEVEHLLELRERAIELEPRLSVNVPVRFDKQFTCCNAKCKGIAIDPNIARRKVVDMWLELVLQCKMPSSALHEAMFFEQMSTKMLLDRNILCCTHVYNGYMDYVFHTFGMNICCAGDPVGMKGAQDSVQPLTQTILKRFHISGEKTCIVSSTTRVREIINLIKEIERPMMYVFLMPEHEETFNPMNLVELRLSQIVTKYNDALVFLGKDDDPDDEDMHEEWQQRIRDQGNFPETHIIFTLAQHQLIHLTLYLNQNIMHRRELSPRETALYLMQNASVFQLGMSSDVVFTHAELEDELWWITLSMPRSSALLKSLSPDSQTLPAPLLVALLHRALVQDSHFLAGIEGVHDFVETEKQILVSDEDQDGKLILKKRKCYLTLGSNLQAVCALPEVDVEETTSNDINQVYEVFGVDAAQHAIEENLLEAMQMSDTSVAAQHVKLIAATMCFTGCPVALNFSGMTGKETASWFKRATFERSLVSFLGAGIAAHKDKLRGVSEAILAGTKVTIGTGGDFAMIPNPKIAQKYPKIKCKRFVFTAPEIETFLTNPSEETIVFDLDEKQIEEDVKPILPLSIVIPEQKQQQPKSKPKVFFYAHKASGNVLRPSSPVTNNTKNQTNHFGKLTLFIPSSPKKRKKTERRTPCNNTKKRRMALALQQEQANKRRADLMHYFPCVKKQRAFLQPSSP